MGARAVGPLRYSTPMAADHHLILAPCDPADPDFAGLVRRLDAYLAVTDGDEHAFYDQFNDAGSLDAAVLLRLGGVAIACGGYRVRSADTVEVKRMYVREGYRRCGAAAEVLAALERDAREAGYRRAVLETGLRQRAAVRFYEARGYRRLARNYPPYEGMANSVCYEKSL